MRADRLLSILLLLQSHPRLSAVSIAARLEVSPRTVQRDMLALSAAGAPVYAARGSRGGWSLLEGYHTDLSGLSQAEAHSLTLLAPAQVLDDLGLRQASITGLIKLMSGLPDAQRRMAEDVRQRVLVDAAGWRAAEEATPAFAVMQEAVWRDRQARVEYQRGDGTQVERVIEPLGLVAKGRIWYVVAQVDGVMRTYRVGRMRAAYLLDDPVKRPTNFDLAAYWESAQAEFTAALPSYAALLRINADRLPFMRAMWRFARFGAVSALDDAGWVTANVTFENREEACFCTLGMGAHLEVIAPDELCALVAQRAAQVAQLYKEATAPTVAP